MVHIYWILLLSRKGGEKDWDSWLISRHIFIVWVFASIRLKVYVREGLGQKCHCQRMIRDGSYSYFPFHKKAKSLSLWSMQCCDFAFKLIDLRHMFECSLQYDWRCMWKFWDVLCYCCRPSCFYWLLSSVGVFQQRVFFFMNVKCKYGGN